MDLVAAAKLHIGVDSLWYVPPYIPVMQYGAGLELQGRPLELH